MAKDLTVNKAVRLCLTTKLDFKDFKAIYELYKETNDSLLGDALAGSTVLCYTEDEMQELNKIKGSLNIIIKGPQTNKEVSQGINICLTQKIRYEEFKRIYKLYQETKDKLLGKALSEAIVEGTAEEIISASEYMNLVKEELGLEENKTQGL